MLNSFKHNIYLMREEMEFNSVVKDIYDKEQFLYLNINSLKNELFKNPDENYIQDYIMMMSLLGNDFVPHSLSLTIKDGGYVLLFDLLKQFHKQDMFLVRDKTIQWDVLKEFIDCIKIEEPSLIEHFCKKKKTSFSYKGNTEYEQKMSSVYTLPTRWFVESEIYENGLKQGWEDTYYNKFLNNNKPKIIKEYLKGLQWVIDYYNGKEVEFDWYYPYMNTPLWKDIHEYLCVNSVKNFNYNYQPPIKPEQQLVMVLPPHSYNLITNSEYKKFLHNYPQFYPKKFGVHSLGKKWIYECESNIPIISTKFLRRILV